MKSKKKVLVLSHQTKQYLRVPFCKNQTNFKFRGTGRKFDFAHILMVDSLEYDKNYWIVFLAIKEIFKFPKSVKIVILPTILFNKFDSLARKTTTFFPL